MSLISSSNTLITALRLLDIFVLIPVHVNGFFPELEFLLNPVFLQ